MEKLSIPSEGEQRGHPSEKKSEQKAEELMDAVNERIKYLEAETPKDYDRTRESHQKAIEFAQNFLVMNERHTEEDWYVRLHGAIVRYETLFVKKMIGYVNEAILEASWDPMKTEHMGKIHDEIINRYIPIYKSYGMTDVVDKLQTIVKTVELKLKVNN